MHRPPLLGNGYCDKVDWGFLLIGLLLMGGIFDLKLQDCHYP